jgi:tetratricopeptide (TPR) repeat protein
MKVMPLYYQGRHEEALDQAGQAIQLWDPKQPSFLHSNPGITARVYAAQCEFVLGYPDRGLETATTALMLARQLNHPFSIAPALMWRGYLLWYRGDTAAAIEDFDEDVDLCTRFGIPNFLAAALYGREGIRAEERKGEKQSLDQVERDSEGIARVVSPHRPQFIVQYVYSLRNLEQYDKALDLVDGELARAESDGLYCYSAYLHGMRGDLLLERDPLFSNESQAAFLRSIELARGQRAKSWELRAANSLARLWHSHGKTAEARDLLAPVYDWFTEGFDTRDLKDAKALLDECT